MRRPLHRGTERRLAPRFFYVQRDINNNLSKFGATWYKTLNSMQVYKEWLRCNGYRFEETDFGLVFKHQGAVFIIFHRKNDPSFFQLALPGIYEVKQDEKTRVLEIANMLSNELKCLKCIVHEDNDVWLMTEMFTNKEPELDNYMERLLDILHEGRRRFYSELK